MRASVSVFCTLASLSLVGIQPCQAEATGDPAPRYRLVEFAGSGQTVAAAINARGQVAGWTSLSNNRRRPFLWSEGKTIDLGLPPGYRDAVAVGITDDDTVLVNAAKADGLVHPFLWRNGHFKDIGNRVPLQKYQGGYSKAINAAGMVVGIYGNENTTDNYGRSIFHAFAIQGATFHKLRDFGGNSYAYAANEEGRIVGKADIDIDPSYRYPAAHGYTCAMLWRTDGTPVVLRTFDQDGCALAVNEKGQAVGYFHVEREGRSHAFVASAAGDVHDLTPSATAVSMATGINTKGQIVGYSWDTGSASVTDTRCHANLWQDGKQYDLNTRICDATDWTLTDACAINDAGLIIGSGLHHGKKTGFLLVPESPEAGDTHGKGNREESALRTEDTAQPDIPLRQQFRTIRPGDIAFLMLHGETTSCAPLTITDHDLIEQFLFALQNADYGSAPDLWPDSERLEVRFKAAKTRAPIVLHLDPNQPEFTHGQFFEDAYHTLAQHQMAALKDFAHRAEKIHSIHVGDTVVSEPAAVARLRDYLTNLDPKRIMPFLPAPQASRVQRRKPLGSWATVIIEYGVHQRFRIVTPWRPIAPSFYSPGN